VPVKGAHAVAPRYGAESEGRSAVARQSTATHSPAAGGTGTRFPPELMHAAAFLYYTEESTQAEIADRLGTSRSTVSRLLSEARRLGIVRIEVVAPVDTDDETLAARTAEALGLNAVYVTRVAHHALIGVTLAAKLAVALEKVGLRPGDILLVSSGRTVYEAAQAELPRIPGVLVTPMLGGQNEAEAWYQTNEITRQVAEKVGGRPVFLYAPALPAPPLFERLVEDPDTRRVLELWGEGRCAIVGVGGPPLTRHSLPGFLPHDGITLRDAVGDVGSRFYDRAGRPVTFPGESRLIAMTLEAIRRVPTTIALAVGQEKVPGIMAAARSHYFTDLVTDSPTAAALLAAAAEE
jgi:DNA-binding transcriptional regulator LsrR (DeoR family)